MKPFRVKITGGCGGHVSELVFATSAKYALQAVLNALPINHEVWNYAGWRDVSIYEEKRAFIVKGES